MRELLIPQIAMPDTKYLTFGIGCLLLLPFIWSFILMVLPDPPPLTEAEREAWARENLPIQPTTSKGPDSAIVMGMTMVTTYQAVTPHPNLGSIWMLAKRKWVGVIGLAASLLLLLCLFVSSFIPVVTESYTIEHKIELPEPPANDLGRIELMQLPTIERENSIETDPKAR